jgi:ribonuclease HII
MRRALLALSRAPAHVVIDGNRCPPLHDLPFICTSEAVVKGDAKIACIGAASILAKVARDEYMLVLDEQYPGYGLGIHKGYPTAMHLAALRQLGPSTVHRRSFGPVQSCLPG